MSSISGDGTPQSALVGIAISPDRDYLRHREVFPGIPHIVEFALETINQPIGVSTYQVTRELPVPMEEELPSVEDLQEVVNKLRSEMETLRGNAPDEE